MELLHVTKDNVESIIKKNKILLIDFWAPWCGPCRMLTPVLQKLSDSGVTVVGKVNVDEEPELAQIYNVRSIPTLVLYKDGKIVEKKVGYQDIQSLVDWIKSYE
mgnify:CR=1 FL=1